MVARNQASFSFAEQSSRLPSLRRNSNRTDVVAERPGAVMVLAVDIVPYSPAQADKTRARRDRQEPALRDTETHDRVERDPRFSDETAALRVKGDNSIEPARGQQRVAVIQTGVSQAAPHPVRKKRNIEPIERYFLFP